MASRIVVGQGLFVRFDDPERPVPCDRPNTACTRRQKFYKTLVDPMRATSRSYWVVIIFLFINSCNFSVSALLNCNMSLTHTITSTTPKTRPTISLTLLVIIIKAWLVSFNLSKDLPSSLLSSAKRVLEKQRLLEMSRTQIMRLDMG